MEVNAFDFPTKSEVEVEPGLFVSATAELTNKDKDTERGGFKTLPTLSLVRVPVVDGCALSLEEADDFVPLFPFPLESMLLCSLLPDRLVILEVAEES